MSRATNPRKLELLEAFAPWPISEMIGPWWDGSLFGLDESKAIPGDGAWRSAPFISLPRHAVSAVATRSWKLLVLPLHGDTAPVVGPGALR